eukprot:g6975.t1
MSSLAQDKGDAVVYKKQRDNNTQNTEKNGKRSNDTIEAVVVGQLKMINLVTTESSETISGAAKTKLAAKDAQRLANISKLGKNSDNKNSTENVLMFFSRLSNQFENNQYNNKTKELFAKALTAYFKQIKQREYVNQRTLARLMQKVALSVFKKPKFVKHLTTILQEFKDVELQEQINSVRDALRSEEGFEPMPINFAIVNKIAAAFKTVETFHSSWQRARLFDVVYNTVQSISDQGVSDIDVLTKLKDLIWDFVNTTGNIECENSIISSGGTIFSENQIQKLKFSIQEIGDIHLTMLYIQCSRALYSRSRDGPIAPEELYKNFENIFEYLKTSKKDVTDVTDGKSINNVASFAQLEKIGKLFSTRLIPRITDSVWEKDITKSFCTLVEEVEHLFGDFPELAEVRAEIHYAVEDMEKGLQEELAEKEDVEDLSLPLGKESLKSWCEETAAKFQASSEGNFMHDFQTLNLDLLGIVTKMIPGSEEERKKTKLKKSIEYALKCRWRRSRLFIFGSSGNLYGSPSSDMDLCLRLQAHDRSKACFQIRAALRQYGDGLRFDDINVIARARVPIVKFQELNSGIECDICVDNELAVYNTQLLKAYASLDPRVRYVGLFVKIWASNRGIKRSDSGTLSSYAWIILTIFWLQQIGMVPSLQIKPYVDIERVKRQTKQGGGSNQHKHGKHKGPMLEYEGHNIAFCSERGYFSTMWGDAKMQAVTYEADLCELVYGFFHYFARIFQTRKRCASIRLAKSIEKGKVYRNARRWRLSIEDPFDLAHDLGSPISSAGQKAINEELLRAVSLIENGCTVQELLATNDNDNYLPENVSSQRRRQEEKQKKQKLHLMRKKVKKSNDNSQITNVVSERRVIPGLGEMKPKKKKRQRRKKKTTV